MDPIIVPGIILAAVLLGKKKKEPVIEEEIEERFPISEMPEAAIQPSVVPVPRFVPGVIYHPTPPPPPPPVPVPIPITHYTPPTPPPAPPTPPSLPTGPTTNPPAGEYEWGTVVRHPQWQSLQFSPHRQKFQMRNADGRAVDVLIPDASYNIISASKRGWDIANIIPVSGGGGVGYLTMSDFT